jgi:hypothetical protein
VRVCALVASLVIAADLLGGCSKPVPVETTTSPMSTATTSPTPALNGQEQLTAEELLARSGAALRAAASFRVKISASFGAHSVAFDMLYVGGDAQGTKTEGDQVTEFRRIGPSLYIKGSDAYWSSIVGLQAGRLSGKWVKVDGADSSHAELGPPREGFLADARGMTKAGTSTVNGRPVVVLKRTDATLYVAAEGEPYPIRVESAAGGATGTVDFSDFGPAPAAITPPSGDIIELVR